MAQFQLSVVVPTHNRRTLLVGLLESLARQTTPPDGFEVVVVADGCTDGTVAQLAGVQVPYRLRWIEQPASGPSTARNAGAAAADAPVLLFLDDDVIASADLIAVHLGFHGAGGPLVVLGQIVQDATIPRPGWEHWEQAMLEKVYRAVASGQSRLGGWLFYAGNVSLPRHLFFQQGGFDVGLRRGEDLELGLRLEAAGAQFVFGSSAVAIHRGFRSYDDWCRIHYGYGRLWVVLAREKNHRRLLATTGRHFRRRHRLNQWTAQLCLRWPSLRLPLLASLRAVAAGCDRLGVFAVSRYCYSGIANLLNWWGMADEWGDPATLRQMLRGEVVEPASVDAAVGRSGQ